MKRCSIPDSQRYGAILLGQCMTNQKMRDSPAYKSYLSFATGTASPKKERKYKKPAFPSRKRTLVIVEEEEPEPAKKFVPSKKPSRKQSTGVQIRDTPGVSMSKKKAPENDPRKELFALELPTPQPCGLGDGTGSKPGVLDEPKGKSGDSGEIANVQGDDKDYDRINKELYGDVNVSLTDAEQDDGDEEDADMTDVAHYRVVHSLTQEKPWASQDMLLSVRASALPPPSVHASYIIKLGKKVKELKNVDHSSALLSKIKSKVPNAVKEYLGTSLDDALYKVLKKHDADIIKGGGDS
ncbi:hypothetical protein Tco_0367090 [Tanacetum coccineum]